MTRPLYLAGPMTGIPAFNFPAFDEACATLRAAGHEILSPHELDPPAVQRAARASPDGRFFADGTLAGESWGDMLSRDVKIVADESSGVVLLPGWERSRGARLEAFVAVLCRLPVYVYSPRAVGHIGQAGLMELRAGLLP